MRYTLYLPDEDGAETLALAQRIARIKGESVSSVFAQKLREYVRDNKHVAEAVDRAEKKKGVKSGR